jgi:hypothetical protein
MTLTNQYGQFTDSPVDKRWCLQFKTLFLPTDHRKILNRQPEVIEIYFSGERVYVILFDWKVMSN